MEIGGEMEGKIQGSREQFGGVVRMKCLCEGWRKGVGFDEVDEGEMLRSKVISIMITVDQY